MYDSKNLPLSKKKIVKKSINAFGIIPFIIVGFIPIFAFVIIAGDIEVPLNIWVAIVFWTVIPALLILTIVVGYQYLYYKFYYYNFQDDTAEIKKGVISVATGHVRYSKIQNIYVDQDLLDRIFGLYDVHYETAGERSGFYSHVDGLTKENSDKLVTFLNQRLLNKDVSSTGTPTAPLQTPEQPTVTQVTTDTRTFSRENLPAEKRLKIMMTWKQFFPLIFALAYMSWAIVNAGVKGDDEFKFDSAGISLFITFCLALPIVAYIGSYIYNTIWFKNYYFMFDTSRGLIRTSVIATNEKYVYYNRIQNINVTQGFIERLFRLWNVTIETASEGTKTNTLSVLGLTKANAETLKEFLLAKSSSHQAI